ncbi:MAG: hypothetical protein ABIA75_07430 [Candidatus Neomarinimicrobiota bacterium]
MSAYQLFGHDVAGAPAAVRISMIFLPASVISRAGKQAIGYFN